MQTFFYVSKESEYLRLVKYGSRSSLKAWVKAWRIAVASSNHGSDLAKVQQGRGESDSLLVCILADKSASSGSHESAGRYSGFSSGGTL